MNWIRKLARMVIYTVARKNFVEISPKLNFSLLRTKIIKISLDAFRASKAFVTWKLNK